MGKKKVILRGECMYSPPKVFFLLSEFEFKTVRPMVKEGDFCHNYEGYNPEWRCRKCNYFREIK